MFHFSFRLFDCNFFRDSNAIRILTVLCIFDVGHPPKNQVHSEVHSEVHIENQTENNEVRKGLHRTK